jgi:WD40 repeat protein
MDIFKFAPVLSPACTCVINGYLFCSVKEEFEVRSLHQEDSRQSNHYAFSFRELWPSNGPPNQEQVTSQALSGHGIVRGTSSGRIELTSVEHIFSKPAHAVQAHEKEITGLLVTEKYIVSSSKDTTVCMWTHALELIHVFRHHSTSVEKLFSIPQPKLSDSASTTSSDDGGKQNILHGLHIITMSSDHSLAVLNCEERTVRLFFPSYAFHPVYLGWRGDYCMVQYSNNNLHIWDGKKGALERIVSGPYARFVLETCSSVISIFSNDQQKLGFQKQALSLLSFDSSHVFMVNLKRLLTDEDPGLSKSLLSALLTRGVHAELDVLVPEQSSRITLGVRGANGNLSLMAPKQVQGYSISPTVTATRLLALFLVIRAIFSGDKATAEDAADGPEPKYQRIYSQFVSGLPNAIGPTFCHASLAFLSRYWQDSLPELQKGSRLLFLLTLKQMPQQRKLDVVNYWHRHLPSIISGVALTSNLPGSALPNSLSPHQPKVLVLTKTMSRAAVILAVIGCECPELLSSENTKNVALSLTLLMSEDETGNLHSSSSNINGAPSQVPKSVYRMGAIELLGKGFTVWEPYINASAVVRSLISIGMQILPHGGNPQQQSNTGSPSSSMIDPGIASSTPPPGARNVANAGISAVARQALLAIGHYKMALIVQTVINELEHGVGRGHGTSSPGQSTTHLGIQPSSVTEKITMLRFLSYLVFKAAAALQGAGSLVHLVEAVVRSLDPTSGNRDVLLQPTTATLFELVRRFPGIAFHAGQQRLAAGTQDGRIVVWDVKTAARAHIIEAYGPVPVSAIAFSTDGRSVVSYSLAEKSIKVWQQPSGLLFLVAAATSGTAMKSSKTIVHQSDTLQPLSLRLVVTDHSIEISDDRNRSQYTF